MDKLIHHDMSEVGIIILFDTSEDYHVSLLTDVVGIK